MKQARMRVFKHTEIQADTLKQSLASMEAQHERIHTFKAHFKGSKPLPPPKGTLTQLSIILNGIIDPPLS